MSPRTRPLVARYGRGAFAYLPVLAVSLFGFGASAAGFLLVRGQIRQAIQNEFDRTAEDRAVAIEQALRDKLTILDSVRAMYASAGDPRPEFRALVEPILSRGRGFRSLEWVVRVRAEEQEEFEGGARF